MTNYLLIAKDDEFHNAEKSLVELEVKFWSLDPIHAIIFKSTPEKASVIKRLDFVLSLEEVDTERINQVGLWAQFKEESR